MALLTKDNIESEFNRLIEKKTDILSKSIKIARGCDGIDHIIFSKKIDYFSNIICEKGKAGKYIFLPFREVEVPKPPYEKDQLEEARKAKKIRILSISTIQDTIFQNIMAKVVCESAEQKFKENINDYSYGYRKQKSSKLAVRRILKCIKNGYLHVLDGDIEHFFDNIDHTLLKLKMESFFGVDNVLIQRFLYRFINVKRIPAGKIFNDKNKLLLAEKRNVGIPQGGVLSGLLANIFLYDFDLFVINELMPKYNFKYFRYADDFVLLFKENNFIIEVDNLLRLYLENQKLTLHPIGDKTKILDLSLEKKETLNFLGFEISPKFLKIKVENLKKFKKRILEVLGNIEDDIEDDAYFNNLIVNINAKIVGLEEMIEQENGLCPVCNLLIPKRSWIGYFMMIDDVRLLRNIDTLIRKLIYKNYHQRTKRHLRKKDLLRFTFGRLKSVEQIYYTYKKQIRKYEKMGSCKCKRFYDKENNIIKVCIPTE